MAKDWIEKRKGEFAQQAKKFTDILVADPAKFAISPADADLLSADYADFLAAFVRAEANSTRTPSAIVTCKETRQRLTARMRDLGGRIRANQSISTADKLVLTLTIPGRAGVAPDSSPATRPDVHVRSLDNNILTVSLIDQESSRRGLRPRGVVGAQVFFTTGDQAPLAVELWKPPVVTLSSRAVIRLPWLAPGTKVWVCAKWFDNRGRTGPISNTASTYVGGMTIMNSLAA